MATPLKNSILRGVEESVEAALTPRTRENYMKIWTWGMNLLLDKGRDGIMAMVQKSKDPVKDCALATINLVALLRKESQGTMPVQAMAPAAMSLMLNALDFAERLGVVKIDMKAFVRASHIYTNHIFKVLGVTPAMLVQAGQAVNGVMEHPGKMELVKRRAGVVRDPRASLPLDMSFMPRNRAEKRRQERRR